MRQIRILLIAAICCWITAATQPAHAGADDKAVQKTLTVLVNSIRYNKDDVAAKQLAYNEMSKALMAEGWATMSAEQQKEFAGHLQTLLRLMSFPKGRDMFKYLDALLFDSVKVEGDTAHCKTTVVIHRDVKKAEIPIEWVLMKDGGNWKVVDTVTMGESTAAGIREEQLLPLMKEGGVNAVLDAMRKKVSELKES
jgi:phospholipid transport system substrate-binding protein